MANSESDSNEPKDDQAETPEEHEQPSDADQSDVEDVEDASPDGDDADGESTEEHSDDDQNDESDSDDQTADSSADDDASESDDDTSDSEDDDSSDDESEPEASNDDEDDDSAKASDDEDDDSAEASDDEDDDSAVDSGADADEVTDDDSDDSREDVADGDVLETERFVGDATGHENSRPGIAAFFDHPDDLMEAARQTRDADYEQFDAFSPFPIHGLDEAMGLGRSWMPWVTFGAGLFGFLCAVALEFGTMTFDWPMIIGGKPFAPWPAFVPVMFELTVLIGGVTTGVVMLKAAGCFQPAEVIDPDLTNDRFALWISADDAAYDPDEVVEFVRSMNPTEVRTFTEKADSDA